MAARDLATRVLDVIHQLAAGEFDEPEQRLLTGEIVRSWPVPPVRAHDERTPQDLQGGRNAGHCTGVQSELDHLEGRE